MVPLLRSPSVTSAFQNVSSVEVKLPIHPSDRLLFKLLYLLGCSFDRILSIMICLDSTKHLSNWGAGMTVIPRCMAAEAPDRELEDATYTNISLSLVPFAMLSVYVFR